MTSGNMARRADRLLLAALLAGGLAAHAAEPWTLDRLMQGLAQMRSARASFVEQKTVRVLEQPLVASGELSFTAPDRLEKRTLRPRPELLLLQGETLTLERAGRQMQLDLRSHPEVAAFTESLRGTLAGDRKALERVYHLALNGDTERWMLVLTPLDAKVGKVIARIRMEGARDGVRSVEILQADGDSSLMTIEKPAPPQ